MYSRMKRHQECYPPDFATHVAGMKGNIPDEVKRDNNENAWYIRLRAFVTEVH
jgi:hypothetical protein